MKNIAAFFSFFLLLTAPCHAQDPLVTMSLGQTAEVQIAANDTSTKRVNWAYFSTSKTASTLSLEISAPARTVVSVKALGVPSSYSIEQAMSAFRSAYSLEIAPSSGKFKKSMTIGSTDSGGGGNGGGNTTGMMCNNQMMRMLRDWYAPICKDNLNLDHDPSDDEVCDCVVPGWRDAGSGDDDGGGVVSGPTTTATVHVLKNPCIKSSTKYLVVVTTNIEKVSAGERAAGFGMSMTPRDSIFKGAQESKLKIGDGRIHGLIHMADSLGSDFGMVAKFSTGKIVRMTAMQKEKVGKYAPYRQHLLAVYPIAPLGRTAGRLGFFNANSSSVFGACFWGGRPDQWTRGY